MVGYQAHISNPHLIFAMYKYYVLLVRLGNIITKHNTICSGFVCSKWHRQVRAHIYQASSSLDFGKAPSGFKGRTPNGQKCQYCGLHVRTCKCRRNFWTKEKRRRKMRKKRNTRRWREEKTRSEAWKMWRMGSRSRFLHPRKWRKRGR